LPLMPAFSITTFKVQGLTMGKIVVDVPVSSGASLVVSIYVPLISVE
jgi:hypothetical protein